MKALSLFTLLIACISLQAQSYPSFPDSNAVWTNVDAPYSWSGSTASYGSVYEFSFSIGQEDTVINSLTYHQMMFDESSYVGGLRSENQRVYFNYLVDSTEYLLYDFGADIGDTLYDVFTTYDSEALFDGSGFLLDDVRVDDIDSVLCDDGITRRRLYVFSISDAGSTWEWIEGVGSAKGIFWHAGLNVSNYVVSLGRLCVENQLVYMNPPPSAFVQDTSDVCGSIFTTSVSEIERAEFNVYPNPSRDYVHVESNQNLHLSEVLMHSSIGQVVHHSAVNPTGRIDIDVSGFPPGLYTLRILSEERWSSSTIMVE
jgi:hypothetical protein